MFETLSKGFRAARNRLAGATELTPENIEQALRDVRVSLLEADVEFHVAKRFLASVKEKSLGTVVQTHATIKGKRIKVGPAERFIQICQRELTSMMAAEGEAVQLAKRPELSGVMVTGLQGSGKTTTAAKLARWLESERGRHPLLVAADVQRPGAVEQLQVLGERLQIPVFAIPGGRPVDICARAAIQARKLKRDVLIYDTAGRLAIDEPLMRELEEIKDKVRPRNIFLVVDAMIGQDSVKTANAFHEKLALTGIIMTKLDGDARGGAALSIREATGVPVRFVGMGEALDKLEHFRPEGMADRILGFGDVVGLMKDFEAVADTDKAERDARRMLQGQFTLDDFLEQIETLQKMGPLQDVFEKLPFFSDSIPEGFNLDDRELARAKAIVGSMTKAERAKIELFREQPSRLVRVARGSGRVEKEVADLLQRFAYMRQLMGSIGQQAGMLAKIPGVKQLAMGRRLREVVQANGFEGNPMMANLAEELLEAAVAGQGAHAHGVIAARRTLPARNKRKALRKLQRKSRRKSRR